jgi:GH25 family lysozyme M1 (1,4-beta-N-acetylmuramidase)
MSETHFRKVMDYRFLSAEELKGEVTVTIKEVKQEPVRNLTTQKEEFKAVLYFEGTKKGMVLNKTNAKTISKVLKTPYIENWVGKKIVIYCNKNVKAFGKTTEGIRVKEIIV